MGIVIYMAKRESANIHSVPTTSNLTASVSTTAIKRKNAVTMDAPTMPSGMVFASVMVQSTIAQIPECGKPLFQAQRCSTHFLCLSLAASEFDSTTEDILAAANAMVGMHHAASFTT